VTKSGRQVQRILSTVERKGKASTCPKEKQVILEAEDQRQKILIQLPSFQLLELIHWFASRAEKTREES